MELYLYITLQLYFKYVYIVILSHYITIIK